MFTFIKPRKEKFLFTAMTRLTVFVLSFSLIFGPSAVYAQTHPVGQGGVLNLPFVGEMVAVSPAHVPPMIRGIIIMPDNPFRFDFIVDSGSENLSDSEMREESIKLINYFLASLTIPEGDLWVNLSPNEGDRIVPAEFGNTIMGRDLLEQDYLLKQLTASLMYPEDDLGGAFWNKLRSQVSEKFGITSVPINTFNKVWIIPDKATIYQNGNKVYVTESHLKVMLESDYLAFKEGGGVDVDSPTSADDLQASMVREMIVPVIEREVNEGKNFSKLRQIYHSFILAAWYKENFKQSALNQKYSDLKKVEGIDIQDKDTKQKIYDQYMESFNRGVYNYIKEEYDESTKEMIPRKYFSGGARMISSPVEITPNGSLTQHGRISRVSITLNDSQTGAVLSAMGSSPLNIEDGPRSLLSRVRDVSFRAIDLVIPVFYFVRGQLVLAGIEPKVSMPSSLLDPKVSWGDDEALPESYVMLEQAYASLTRDRVPFVVDPDLSKGSLLATVDKDPATGKPYYLYDLAHFAIQVLGENDPDVINYILKNIAEVANRKAYSDFFTPAYIDYVVMMAEIAPKGLDQFFIANTGAEAVENAIKVVKLRRPESEFIIAFDHAFHGRTMGALGGTDKPLARDGFFHPDWPHILFPAMDERLSDEQLNKKERDSLRQLWAIISSGDKYKKVQDDRGQDENFRVTMESIDGFLEGFNTGQRLNRYQRPASLTGFDVLRENAKKTGGFLAEPYQGEGGINFASKRYFQRLSLILEMFDDAPNIIDAVQGGGGITGTNWAYEQHDLPVAPKIVIFGKKMQMGGIYMDGEYFVHELGLLNTTWGGSDSGILRAVAHQEIIERDDLREKKRLVAEYTLGKLREMQKFVGGDGDYYVTQVRNWESVLAINLPSEKNKK